MVGWILRELRLGWRKGCIWALGEMELLGSRTERRGQEGGKDHALRARGSWRGVGGCVECGMAGVIRIRAGVCVGAGLAASPLLS